MGIKAGDTFGDYQVVRALGAGGMGAVFEVRHLISDRVEAIKVLLPDLEENHDLAERFLREIRLQASLSHPAIATLHTALRHDNQLLMVMEYVRGESLDMALRRERVDLSRAIDIVLQLLDALGYAHSRGIIHRDIKPANIMLTAGGKIKLLDFGIARPLADARLTHTGAAIGSLHYMSPEQIRGLQVDHRTDLYSAGVTLYEMATGVRPFIGDDAYSVMKAHIEQLPRPAELINNGISRELSRVIARSLEKDAAHRFQTADEFSQQLKAAQENLGVATGNLPPPASKISTAEISNSSQPALVLFEPEAIARVTRALASFIGPVAQVLVPRAAKRAKSWDELYQKLAAELPPGGDREKFLASRHR